MDRQDLQDKAFEYHSAGFHCAEAVSKALVEGFGQRETAFIPRAATAFGGGIGRTFEDTCGALTGAVLALGYLFGRSEPGADWREARDLAAELRRRFIQAYGSTNCASILRLLGEQEHMIKCKRLSGQVAGIAWDILRERASLGT